MQILMTLLFPFMFCRLAKKEQISNNWALCAFMGKDGLMYAEQRFPLLLSVAPNWRPLFKNSLKTLKLSIALQFSVLPPSCWIIQKTGHYFRIKHEKEGLQLSRSDLFFQCQQLGGRTDNCIAMESLNVCNEFFKSGLQFGATIAQRKPCGGNTKAPPSPKTALRITFA